MGAKAQRRPRSEPPPGGRGPGRRPRGQAAGRRKAAGRHGILPRSALPRVGGSLNQITWSRSVTSNVAQSYPYSSESESAREATIAGLVATRPGLDSTLATETSPLDAAARWWVWKCPSRGCAGLLHVAGHARNLHGLFVVCDGECAKTLLR